MRFPNRIGSSAKTFSSSVCLTGFSATQKTQDSVGISPVRLGMQIAFGRVRRKTEPTGPEGSLN